MASGHFLILIASFFALGILNCSENSRAYQSRGAFTKATNPVNRNKETDTSSLEKTRTITVTYAVIACDCAQWFESKYGNLMGGAERFYVEPAKKGIKNANNIFDGINLPVKVKLTGRFTKKKLPPPNPGPKSEHELARIFWYDKIIVLSK